MCYTKKKEKKNNGNAGEQRQHVVGWPSEVKSVSRLTLRRGTREKKREKEVH